MAQGKRTSIETRANIVIDKINNPDLSVRDLANKYDVWKSTAWDIIEEVIDEVRTSSDIVTEIVTDALQASKIMWKVTLKMAEDIQDRQIQVEEWAEWMKPTTDEIRTLNATVAEWFKRSQLLQWKPTENHNILWDVLAQLQWLKENS